MRATLVLFFSLTASATQLAAQPFTTTIVTASAIEVFPGIHCQPFQAGCFQSHLAAGTPISATYTRTCCSSIQITPLADGVRIVARAVALPDDFGPYVRGSVLCTFSVGGTIAVSTNADHQFIGFPCVAAAEAAIDVGNDGSRELVANLGASSGVIPIGGLPVLVSWAVSTGCAGGRNGSTQMTIDVRLTPVGTAGFTSQGAGCGTDLVGSDTPSAQGHLLQFDLARAFPNGVAALLFGTSRVAIPLPWPGCELNIDPVIVGVALSTDALGRGQFMLPLPAPLAGSVWAQSVPIDFATFDLRASPSLRVSFLD